MLWDNGSGGGGWGGLLGGLYGGGLLDPELEKRLTPEQRRQLQREAMIQGGAAMLAGSGWSETPITLGQALGAGAMAGRQAYAGGLSQMQQQQAEALKRQQAEQEREAANRYRQGLDPSTQALYDVLGPREYAKQDMQTRGKIAAEKAKTPSETTLARNLQAAGLQPGTPEFQAAMRQQLNKPTGTTVNVGGAGDPNRLGRLATPEEMDFMRQQGAVIPQGVVLQMTPQGWKPIQGTGPTKAQQTVDAAAGGKSVAATNAGMLFDQMEQLLDEGLQTGPIAGSEIAGIPLGRAVDYDRKTLFDAFTKQVSPSLRTIFRIPGEGALSDSEQKQYGLMLPQITYPEEVNRQLMANLRQMLGNMAQQGQQPGAGLDDDAEFNDVMRRYGY